MTHLAMPDGPLSVPAPTRCDNCGASLVGPFCHECGQRDVDHLASVREFVAHIAEAVVGYDSRLWRTARSLFLRPGFLTAEYIAGRRTRYLPPLQLYLIGATLLFVAASFNPMVAFNPTSRRFQSSLPVLNFGDSLTTAQVTHLRAERLSLEVFGERFSTATTGHLSSALVLVVPIFALMLAATFLLRRRPFAHHVLFTLHWMAFYLLISAALQPVPRERYLNGVTAMLLIGLPFVYLLLALRRAYGSGWAATIVRGAALYFAFFVTLVLWLNIVTRYTIRHL